jgi:hypothetical protein
MGLRDGVMMDEKRGKKRRGVMAPIYARCHPVSCIISLLDVFERKRHTGTKVMAGY